jgi:MOSC domain-containing protein
VKSCGAVRVRSAHLDETGLRYDRWWCVVDSRRRVLTQRELPCLALVRPTLTEDELWLDAPRMDRVSLPLTLSRSACKAPLRKVAVMRTTCKALSCSKQADVWITRFIRVGDGVLGWV